MDDFVFVPFLLASVLFACLCWSGRMFGIGKQHNKTMYNKTKKCLVLFGEYEEFWSGANGFFGMRIHIFWEGWGWYFLVLFVVSFVYYLIYRMCTWRRGNNKGMERSRKETKLMFLFLFSVCHPSCLFEAFVMRCVKVVGCLIGAFSLDG